MKTPQQGEEDYADESKWTIIYSPRTLERNSHQENSPRTSSSKAPLNLHDYEPISVNAVGEVGSTLKDGNLETNEVDDKTPHNPQVQMVITKFKEKGNNTYLVSIAAATGAVSFVAGWFLHYVVNKMP